MRFLPIKYQISNIKDLQLSKYQRSVKCHRPPRSNRLPCPANHLMKLSTWDAWVALLPESLGKDGKKRWKGSSKWHDNLFNAYWKQFISQEKITLQTWYRFFRLLWPSSGENRLAWPLSKRCATFIWETLLQIFRCRALLSVKGCMHQ